METMTNELTVIPRTIGMVTRMMDAIGVEDVVVSEEEQKSILILLRATLRE